MMALIPGYGTARFMPDYPVGFTPEPVTGAVAPGLTYQPLPAPDGSIRSDFDLGPRYDGFYVSDPFGRNAEWFDGNTLWNRDVGNPEVSKLINLNDFYMDQLSGLTQWQIGQSPFPPNFSFPANYNPFPGTPANPITQGAQIGLYGTFPPGAALGGMGGFNAGIPGGFPGSGVAPASTGNNMAGPNPNVPPTGQF